MCTSPFGLYIIKWLCCRWHWDSGTTGLKTQQIPVAVELVYTLKDVRRWKVVYLMPLLFLTLHFLLSVFSLPHFAQAFSSSFFSFFSTLFLPIALSFTFIFLSLSLSLSLSYSQLLWAFITGRGTMFSSFMGKSGCRNAALSLFHLLQPALNLSSSGKVSWRKSIRKVEVPSTQVEWRVNNVFAQIVLTIFNLGHKPKVK